MTTFKKLMIVAVVLLGVGAIVGFVPVSSQGVNCGSAFVESRDARVNDLTNALLSENGQSLSGRVNAAAGCSDLRNLLRIPGFILVGAGVVAFFAGVIMNNDRQRRAEAAGS
ncbi:hypothetical protein [Nonomuraea typhae]|uniref:hypothetical protein n=1 Tax=Nonomuraea typhae TaxID=2603600 RepID=UPI0012FA0937|nr:hypothetical protein [Nonomuraea typhae]